MSAAQLIEGILNGSTKVAEIDPSLQWGALGAGVGGAGGLIKALASGKDPKEIIKSTLGGAALGGGVGLSGAAGAKILGANPPKVTGLLEPKKEYRGDFSSAAGTGLIGAGGLLAGASAEEARDRNEAIRKLIQDPHLKGEELFAAGEVKSLTPNAKLNALLKSLKVKDQATGALRSLKPEELAKYLESDDATHASLSSLMAEAKVHATGGKGGIPGSTKDVGKGLTGHSEMVSKFIEHLKGVAASDENRKGVAESLLRKLHSPELQAMERFKPAARFTQILKKFKSPKNLALAAGGIGLGTYGLTGLGEKLWGKKN